MAITIRGGRRSDLGGVYDVLGAAFDDAPLSLFVEQTERDSTLRYNQMRVAHDGARVLAHVRIFARRMLVRGVAVNAGGIGSVASHPDARGRGLPTALLEDAQTMMHERGVALAFLFTGIPAFYERLGWGIVLQPGFDAVADELTAIEGARAYRVRRIEPDDLSALLRLYRQSIAGATGAIVRTPRTWRDAQRWLDEDPGGCALAEDVATGAIVAYVRSRVRDYGYQILEAVHAVGRDAALQPLLRAVGAQAKRRKLSITALVPGDSTLARLLRSLASTRESTAVLHPTMMRVISLQALASALLPQLRLCAAAHPGPAFSIALHAPDRQRLTFHFTHDGAGIGRSRAPAFELTATGTLDLMLGQRRASGLLRPRPDADVRRRVDALFPERPLHFWNADRI